MSESFFDRLFADLLNAPPGRSFTEQDFERLIDSIVRGCTSPDQCRAIVQRLGLVDWPARIAARDATNAAARQAYNDELVTCEECGGTLRRGDSVHLGNEVPFTAQHLECCSSCAAIVRARYARTCLWCGEGYRVKNHNTPDSLCPTCRTDDRACELDRLRPYLRQAVSAGLESSLTIKQWMQAIGDFAGLCAYCRQRPFTVIEHFLPVRLGGGTTARNCVPACDACNGMKSNIHPDRLIGDRPPGVARVRACLETRV